MSGDVDILRVWTEPKLRRKWKRILAACDKRVEDGDEEGPYVEAAIPALARALIEREDRRVAEEKAARKAGVRGKTYSCRACGGKAKSTASQEKAMADGYSVTLKCSNRKCHNAHGGPVSPQRIEEAK